ncbi:MAG: VOC family protein [Nitrososphaerota archaeon]|nr:VOC family protein [Nitrososphaerota archaeon]
MARFAPTFRDPQVNLYVKDAEVSARFYRDFFGFRETFRTPKRGSPIKIELQLGNLILGVGTSNSVREVHGFSTGGGPPRAEVVLWTDDVDKAFASLTERGVTPLSAPHDFVGTVRGTWILDPDGNPVQIVSKIRAR